MSSSVLEQFRTGNEDIETIEKAISKIMEEKADNSRKVTRVVYDHAIGWLLRLAKDKARECLDIHTDSDHSRREELGFLAGERQGQEDNIWNNFYNKVKVVKDYHRKFSDLNSVPEVRDVQYFVTMAYSGGSTTLPEGKLTSSVLVNGPAGLSFSSTESLGRRVDMHELYTEFCNMKKLRNYRERRWMTEMADKIQKKFRNKRKALEEDTQEETGEMDGCGAPMIEDTDAPIIQDDNDDEKKNEKNEKIEKIENLKKKREGKLQKLDHLKEQEEQQLSNLKDEFIEMDYIGWLRNFDRFHDIPRYCKYNCYEYSKYILNLCKYLYSCLSRLYPLADHSTLISHFVHDFRKKYDAGELTGWESHTCALACYCLPSHTLFASPATMESHMKGKKYLKSLEVLSHMDRETQHRLRDESVAQDRRTALVETLIQRLKEAVAEQMDNTVNFVQKRQSMTEVELNDVIEAENEEFNINNNNEEGQDGDEGESVGDADERPVYNPLNLPIGWDGKPMPFWLYKLNGLGQEHKCEICGNYSYWGRKNFERHFSEWRHAYGMRCLKIPNTTHFKEITKIEDALNLYEKLKHEAEEKAFKPANDVECEDQHGNVMSLRDFDELRRQGLL
eukprot:GHVR01147485.1.p1 GENE.GHVR01147485.1~~GHVR01147485.1.p1  ORF type:complete len:633 (-),score=152.06 GHVR01147485.1:37-1893(-)